ncbi:response regulator [Chryseobacterium sp. CKR4-1]|uniref:ATP-binding response regulator n=1 Tax=Chryseobacterium sp. CKR4-1 TaxID=3068896 RepID=UPI0027967F35|nr:response regulator [Chryseobacterium sp. CKR4-1]MDQ1803066.1 response regulator [Chryseobacterium sp. CKR4-1]
MSYSLESIRHIGTSGVSEAQRKVILIVNTISIITSLLAVSAGTFLFVLTGKAAIGIAAYTEVGMFSSIIVMNHYKKYGVARIAIHIFQNATVLYFGLLFGKHVDVKLMVVFLGIIPLLLFTDKHVKITCSIVTCVTLFILEYNYQYPIFEPISLSLHDERITRWLSLAVILFLVMVVVWFNEEDKRKANESLAHANERLEQLTDQLQQSVASKVKYVQQITHEIRGPFNAIFSIAQQLLDKLPKLDNFKHIEDDIQTLNAGCYQTLNIINSALDVSKLEVGSYPVTIGTICVRNWIKDIMDIFQYIASHKQVTIKTTVRPSVPSHIKGDHEKLTRIVNNLLYNAIKFTRKNSTVTITVDSNETFWNISVADQGIGIPKVELEEAFKIFHSSSTDSAEGTGLGLFFVSETIGLLKGKIEVFTRSGRGSNFVTQFPLITAAPITEPRVDESALTQPDLTGKQILIIDDDLMQATYLKRFLESNGAIVRLAETGMDGFCQLDKQAADLIVLDNTLPDISGIEALHALQKSHFDLIPVIMVTADKNITRDDAIAAGACEYLLKPVILKELRALVGNCFQVATTR